jgi:hypothetical protein
MKRFTQILLIVSCTVACLLPLRMSAQCPTSTPCSPDSIDLIVILNNSVNNDPARVSYFMTQLGVRQLSMTAPSNARLWRLPKCNCTSIDGEAISWDGDADAVEKTGPKIDAVGMSENWEITVAPTTFTEGQSPQSLGTLFNCTTNVDSTILACTRGTEGVRVAILDSGASSNLSPLSPYIERLKSWNFIDDNPDFTDGKGHGNFVANIIRPFMSSRDSLYIYKVLNNSGSGKIYDAIEAIDRSSNEGIDILNASFVAKLNSQISTPITPFNIAIDSARVRNVLCIVAAGNDNASLDNSSYSINGSQFYTHYTPASEINNNIITVMSFDCCVTKSSFSNYGVINADIATLGEGILSYWLHDVLQRRSGTSFATPQITGVALLLYSNIQRRNRSYVVIKNALLKGSVYSSNLKPYCLTSGIVNAPKAYCLLTSRLPATCSSSWSPHLSCPILVNKDISFTARLHNQTVYLEWSFNQISQKNTSFIIEKSDNGRNFEKLLNIEADQRKQYSEIDRILKSGIVYYRLLTIDDNGSRDTSQTIALSMPVSGKISIFPNPTQAKTIIQYELPMADKISIELVDMMGKIYPILLQQNQNKGFNEYSFDAQSFKAGIYQCRLIGSRTFLHQKIIITP